jgi:citrate lyase subunit beta / citryl-CoA lyase
VSAQQVRRSWLLIPAHRSDLVQQSDSFGADVVVFDLEDLVHDQRKAAARANVRQGIERARQGGAEVFVRCDLELLYADLEASVWRGLQGIILPKVSRIEQIREAEAILSSFEAERGVLQAGLLHEVNEFDEPRSVANSLEIQLALENAEGNQAAMELLESSPRIRSVSLGRADLVMDLREEPNGELHLLPFLMQRLIIIANTVGVVPIGAWWQAGSRGARATPELSRRAARRGWLAGFKGGWCLDPEQVPAFNAGFTPADHEAPAWATACRERDMAKTAAAEWAARV